MSQTNGHTPDPTALLEHVRARVEVARAEHQLARLQRHTKQLTESNILWDQMSGYQDMLDRMRTEEGRLLLAPSTVNDRRYGANWPFWRTWTEHSILRAQARFICTTNDLASGALSGLCSYVVGPGYKHTVAARKGRKAPPSLLDALQAVIDDYSQRNDLPGLEQECFKRSRRDGEFFLRHFEDDGLTETCVVEPEQVMDATHLPIEEGLFGVITPPGHVSRPVAYFVCYDGSQADGEEVPAGTDMIHFKVGVDRTIKRGMPDFVFDTYEGLKVAGRCVQNMIESAAIQASVAEIRQHETATVGAVQDFVSAEADYQAPNPWQGSQVNNRVVRPGEVRDIPKGMTYVPPPFSDGSPAWIQVTQAALRKCGVKWNAPEWLVSSDASSNSYANAIVSESPFVRRSERWQGAYKRPFRGNVEHALRNACEAGLVKAEGRTWTWREVCHLVEVQSEPPSLITRNTLQEAQTNEIRQRAGVISTQTWCSQDGLDYEEQQVNIKKHVEGGGQAGEEGQEKGKAGQGQDAPTSQSLAALQGLVYEGKLPREAAVVNAMVAFGFEQAMAVKLFPEVKPHKTTDDGQQGGGMPGGGQPPAGGGQPGGAPPIPGSQGQPEDGADQGRAAEAPGEDSLAGLLGQAGGEQPEEESGREQALGEDVEDWDADAEGQPLLEQRDEVSLAYLHLEDLLEDGTHKVGEVWQGGGGRWFTLKQEGDKVHVRPAKNPNATTPEKKPRKKAEAGATPKTPKAPKEAPRQKVTLDEIHQRIQGHLQTGQVDAHQAKDLAFDLMDLTVKELGELKTRLGLKASGVKMELARKIAEKALEKVRQGGGAPATKETPPAPREQPKPPPKEQPKATPPVASTPAQHATLASAFQSVQKDGLASLADLKDALKVDTPTLHRIVNDLRRQGVLSASNLEGRHGTTAREREAAIDEHGEVKGLVSVKDEAAFRKLLGQGGKAEERPKGAASIPPHVEAAVDKVKAFTGAFMSYVAAHQGRRHETDSWYAKGEQLLHDLDLDGMSAADLKRLITTAKIPTDRGVSKASLVNDIRRHVLGTVELSTEGMH